MLSNQVGCISTESLDFDLNNQKAVWNATQKSVQVCTCFWDLYFFEENTGLSAEYWRNSLLAGEMRVLKKVTRTVILNFPWQPHESVKTAVVIFHF
jgi:hypothetical protein